MKPDEAPQSSTRVRLNGGLGGWAVYGCRIANEAKNPKQPTRPKPYGRPGLAAMQNRLAPRPRDIGGPGRRTKPFAQAKAGEMPRGANGFFTCPAVKHQFCRQSRNTPSALPACA